MKKLEIKDMQFLRRLYANNGPKYVPTIGLLDHFINRFENHPEWMDKVQFVTINENALNEGTFNMVYNTVDGLCISFNSLESKPYRNLGHLLNTLNYSEKKLYTFWTIREEFRILIANLVKTNNLQILENNISECHVFKLYEEVLKMIRDAPEGFYYDSLKEEDVPKINSTLSYTLPSGYLEAVIQYNPTTALYTNDGELIAWVIMHETGDYGMLEVVEKYKRRGFGRELVLRQSIKLQDRGSLIFRHIFHGNIAGHDFSDRVNNKISDGTSAGKFIHMSVQPKINENSGIYLNSDEMHFC